MNTLITKIFVIVYIAYVITCIETQALNRPISGDLISTARIVAKLCLCKNNDSVAAAFFACYDVAPGKDLFAKCQMEVNGYLLNTAANVRKSCRSLGLFPRYAACLQREFQAAGLNLQDSLDKVNKCEAQVVGIN